MTIYQSWTIGYDGVLRETTNELISNRRRKPNLNLDNQDYDENTELLRNDGMDGINGSSFKEQIYNLKMSKDDVQIRKFPRSDYTFVNGVRDDKDYLIIAHKGVLDKMAEDATVDPESAKRVDSKKLGGEYWIDENGNLRCHGDGLDSEGGLDENYRQIHIDSWNQK